MHSFTTILFSSAILGLAAAAPSPDIWRGCHNGKQFYSCYSNGFRGCCSVDPCNLSTCPDDSVQSSSTTTLATLTTSRPVYTPSITYPSVLIPSSTQSPAPSCKPGKHRAYLPDTYAIFPDKPNEWRNQSSTYHVSQELNGANKRDALLRFKLPPGAQKCTLAWQQPVQGTNFGYFNTGLVGIFDLVLPSSTKFDSLLQVTYDKVKQYKSAERTGSADFTFWPESTSFDIHVSGAGYCAEEVVFWTSMVGSPEGAEGSVVMWQAGEEGREAGWFLSYEC